MHRHAPPAAAPAARRSLTLAFGLTAGFAIVEAVGGWYSGSLALLSDAGHMGTDAAALGLALFAHAVAQQPPSRHATYGYARAEVLAAFVNALAMLAIVVAIAVEAVKRLLAPAPVAGALVLAIAIGGLAVNLLCAWILSRGGAGSMNARGALLHVLGDALGSVAAIVAGAVILFTGWTPVDPILSFAVCLLILRAAWQLLRQSTGVLMEGVPAHLDSFEIGAALAALPGVTGVHDLHVWPMTSERAALSAHITLTDGTAWPVTLVSAQRLLRERFGIEHVTLQPAWPLPRSNANGQRVIPVLPHDGEPH